MRFVSVNFANSSLIVDTDNIEIVKRKIKDLEPDVELIELEKKNLLPKVILPILFGKKTKPRLSE